MSEKQFVGRVQEITTKYGPLVKIGISESDFKKFSVNGWLNVIVKKSKEGKTYLELDTWVPDKKMSSAKNVGDVFNTLADMTRPEKTFTNEQPSDLPF